MIASCCLLEQHVFKIWCKSHWADRRLSLVYLCVSKIQNFLDENVWSIDAQVDLKGHVTHEIHGTKNVHLPTFTHKNQPNISKYTIFICMDPMDSYGIW